VTTGKTKRPGTPEQPPTAPPESPLVPHKKLRALYTGMVELRLLESFAKTKMKRSLRSSSGVEACRVSTSLDLESGDISSDFHPTLATEFLRGAKLATLLTHTEAVSAPAHQVPALASCADQLLFALGSAFALKANRPASKPGNLVMAYIQTGDLKVSGWKLLLRLAAAHDLPIILVALPDPRSASGRLSRLATKNGVPGIMVDAADPVALYRVAQESMERVRHTRGGVLIECVPYLAPLHEESPKKSRKRTAPDPLQIMEQFLLDRQVVTQEWMTAVRTKFLKRLQPFEG